MSVLGSVKAATGLLFFFLVYITDLATVLRKTRVPDLQQVFLVFHVPVFNLNRGGLVGIRVEALKGSRSISPLF